MGTEDVFAKFNRLRKSAPSDVVDAYAGMSDDDRRQFLRFGRNHVARKALEFMDFHDALSLLRSLPNLEPKPIPDPDNDQKWTNA